VKGLLEAIAELGHTELKKNGIFVLPGLVRMVVVKKPATKERKGVNPFTGEPTVFKAKPARKVIKARPGQGGQGRHRLISGNLAAIETAGSPPPSR
jgi:hypothetical protein